VRGYPHALAQIPFPRYATSHPRRVKNATKVISLSLWEIGSKYCSKRARSSFHAAILDAKIKFHSQFPILLPFSSRKGTAKEGEESGRQCGPVGGKNKLCARHPTTSSRRNIDFRRRWPLEKGERERERERERDEFLKNTSRDTARVRFT